MTQSFVDLADCEIAYDEVRLRWLALLLLLLLLQ
jgi:hypothetical protein